MDFDELMETTEANVEKYLKDFSDAVYEQDDEKLIISAINATIYEVSHELAHAIKTEQAKQTRVLLKAMNCSCKYTVDPAIEPRPDRYQCNRCKQLGEIGTNE